MSATPRDRLANYLRATGWEEPGEEGPAGSLWLHPESGLRLPVPTNLAAGGLDWDQILYRIARVEHADPRELAARVSGRLVDVANLRAANDIVIADTIPYVAGVALVKESWTMFRSCATTSMGTKHHIRRYRQSADDLAERARMAHTKRGSFIIPILMPLPETQPVVPGPQGVLATTETAVPESAERRAMRTFAEAISTLERVAVRPESEPSTDDMYEMVHAGVSHEFSAALGRILSQPAVAEFSAEFLWAPGAGPAPATPGQTSIPSAAVERVTRVSERLRTEAARRGIEVLTGPVVGVRRADDDQSGVVTVQTVRNARTAHVTINVSRDRLYEALDWMRDRETVVVEGRVHRVASGLHADRRDGISLLRAHHLGS